MNLLLESVGAFLERHPLAGQTMVVAVSGGPDSVALLRALAMVGGDVAPGAMIVAKKLRVFPTDADLPKDVVNHKIDELFVPAAKVKLPDRGKFDEWKTGLLKQLREQSFHALPDKILPAVLTPITSKIIRMRTEGGVAGLMKDLGGPDPPKTITLWVVDADLASNEKELNALATPYMKDSTVLALFTRGLDRSVEWSEKSPPNYVRRSHVLLGMTIDQGRVHDLLAVIRTLDEGLPKEGKVKLRIVGKGQAGILAAYAALFEPRIEEIVVIDPPKSHKEGPTFLNVLRVLDIPDALGMLAPRQLTLINAKDRRFERTVQIYQAAGATNAITRK